MASVHNAVVRIERLSVRKRLRRGRVSFDVKPMQRVREIKLFLVVSSKLALFERQLAVLLQPEDVAIMPHCPDLANGTELDSQLKRIKAYQDDISEKLLDFFVAMNEEKADALRRWFQSVTQTRRHRGLAALLRFAVRSVDELHVNQSAQSWTHNERAMMRFMRRFTEPETDFDFAALPDALLVAEDVCTLLVRIFTVVWRSHVEAYLLDTRVLLKDSAIARAGLIVDANNEMSRVREALKDYVRAVAAVFDGQSENLSEGVSEIMAQHNAFRVRLDALNILELIFSLKPHVHAKASATKTGDICVVMANRALLDRVELLLVPLVKQSGPLSVRKYIHDALAVLTH